MFTFSNHNSPLDMLDIHHVTKRFGSELAVHNLNLKVPKGHIVSLIGPNGSGKTTTVKMIAGLLRPTQGSIKVNGHDILKDSLSAKAALGYIPDEPGAWPGMTGEEFLHFVGALYGMSAQERTDKIAGLLPIFALEGKEKNAFRDYSRGNKQKFTILAALMHEPKLLLIDEPIVGLDPTSAQQAKHLFSEVAKKGHSVLMVTHTLSVAQEISDTVGVLSHGELRAHGSLDSLRKEKNLDDSADLQAIYDAYTSS